MLNKKTSVPLEWEQYESRQQGEMKFSLNKEQILANLEVT